ncbi:lipocalin family protein [uncultured Thiohalocapsa sp.]|uniref:lipocalin-like domain-containing protein n=1 Tax=uncultured Thiohalocapsa sp. TaxID=768990 RepID=UPI0025F4F731|nr:lipocalin family protein [uncultured Thiohalocapsa sp.]
MRPMLTRALPWLAVALIALSAWKLWPTADVASPQLLDPAALAAALPATDGFAVPEAGADWRPELPQDLGPHPAFRTELWDLSGQLRADDGRRYGLHLTLVRLGLRPPGGDGGRASGLAADGLLLGRFVLVPENGAPVRAQRASRVAAGLAGAAADPPVVWLEDWRLLLGSSVSGFDGASEGAPAAARLDVRDGVPTAIPGRLALVADGTRLELTLTAQKPVITPAAQLLDGGAAGVAGQGGGPALRWLAEPRLALSGRLQHQGAEIPVSGSAWLDHVWGAAGAGAGLAGTRGQLALNRFLLQLDDGSELLCLHLRRRAGGGTPIPTCLLIAADGATRVLRRRALTLTPTAAVWRSADGVATYPVGWRLVAPGLDLSLDISALHPAQELELGERLWSGAITVEGARAGRPVSGGGRMDLSGYAADG